MRIWLINVGEEIPTDSGTPRLLRTGILAEHLAKRGHTVTWWNATVNHQRKHQRANRSEVRDLDQGYKLILLYGRLYMRNISVSRIVSQIENAREFTRIAPQQPAPDVILCGYPTIELAHAAVTYANQHNIPIAVDFRDLWPDVVAEQTTGLKRIFSYPLLAYWRWCLRRIVHGASAVVGVTDKFVDWALASVNRPRKPLDQAFHLAINPQLPDTKLLSEAEIFWDEQGITTDSPFMIGCFVGTLSRRLDIETLVHAVLQLSEEEKSKLRLVICGKGDFDQRLRSLARGQACIVFPGWRTAAEIHVLLRRCQFGTIPYLSTSDFVRHYPNKVGEYLGAGLPIMTGLTGQVRTLLRDHDIGYFYRENDPKSAADCLRSMLQNQDGMAAKRTSALQTYEKYFESNRIYASFCDYLENLPTNANVGDAQPSPTPPTGRDRK